MNNKLAKCITCTRNTIPAVPKEERERKREKERARERGEAGRGAEESFVVITCIFQFGIVEKRFFFRFTTGLPVGAIVHLIFWRR